MPRPFANLDGLLRLSHNEGVDIRPSLLRVITDLFVQEPTHTREEEQQYVELATGLMPVVDAQTRATVLSKLKAFPSPPAALLDQIERHAAEHAATVAQATPPAATAKTVPVTPVTIAARTQQSAPEASTHFTHPAPTDIWDTPSTALADFSSITASSIGERFLRAETAERQQMLQQLDAAALTLDPAAWPPRPGAIDRLETAAMLRSPNEFARELQHSLGLSSRLAGRVAHDDGGEPLLVIAKTLGMPSNVVLRILLLLNPAIGESVQRVFALYRLYEHIGLAAVAPIVASWREESRSRPRARYQPLHASDALPARAALRDGARAASEATPEAAPARPSALPQFGKRQGTT